jgi:hypothetical protein
MIESAAAGAATSSVESAAPAADVVQSESYRTLRQTLGEDGFSELAHLIRTTYEANEQRRLRQPSEPPWRDTGGEG